MCALPWELLPSLSELRVQLNAKIAQGTFAFLPRVPSLKLLRADVDFFSVRCLQYLTNLQRLDLSVAAPDDGYLTDSQACERNDEVLAHVARLSKL